MPLKKTNQEERLKSYIEVLWQQRCAFDSKKVESEKLNKEELQQKMLAFDIGEVQKSQFGTDMKLLRNLIPSLEVITKSKKKYYGLNCSEKPQLTTLLSARQVTEIKSIVNFLSSINNPLLQENISLLITKFEEIVDRQKESEIKSILFDSSPISKGHEYITQFYNAIREKNCAFIHYKKFDGEFLIIDFTPYFLEEYNKRWYIVGYSEKLAKENSEMLFNLALDRIIEVNYNAKKEYKINHHLYKTYLKSRNEVVGITNSKLPLMNLKIKADEKVIGYIKTKPIFKNQKILEGNIISLQVRENYELISLLLSFGSQLKVLEPANFRNKIKGKIQEMLSNYED